ncbi:universal stress protein [Chromobacterium sp. Beijing]|uniref:universal stress protein n=1 Tax=Chromobacterium sp. Beijing TaxID=2735795 RepID=UPI002108022E|nr:universal stress protein [Chromobacterium sp. Beijing]
MYQRIFVPVDDSETSNLALHEACHLAKEVGASLKLVHVVDLAQFGWGGTEFLDATELQKSIKQAGEQVLARPGPRPRSWA